MKKEYIVAYEVQGELQVYLNGTLFTKEEAKEKAEILTLFMPKEKIKVFKLVKEVK